ncbi:MAG: cadherin-like domain-containing protein, partial [Acidobacteria bacterium]|nr:cadherin-like domain-containing protein [Acidobacteriota bacterium]
MPANMSFHLTGGPGVRITVTQLPDGKLQVTAAINAAALVGDLRGLFFHVADASLLGGLSVSDATSPVSAFQQSANAVSNLGAGVTMAGSAQPFDVGIAFGTASAAGADDIRTVSFTLDHDTQALTLDTVAQLQFGAVLTSVGAAAGARFATIRATGASPGNVAPTATPDTGTVDEGQSVLLDVLLNDTDPTSDPLTITAFTPPAAGSVSLEAGKLRFDTAGAFEDLGDGDSETVTFGYTVSDGRGGSAAGSVQVVVNGVNDAPTEIALDDTSVPENSAFGTLVGLLSSADIDGGPATYSLIGPAVPFAIDGNRLEVDGALDFETQSSWAITVRADDGAGGIVDQAFSITVTDVDEGGGNVAPTVTDDSRTVAEDGVLVASLAGLVTDPDSAA